MAASPTTTSPPTRSLTSQSSQGGEILFESYLHKTPPLDKLFVVREDPYERNRVWLCPAILKPQHQCVHCSRPCIIHIPCFSCCFDKLVSNSLATRIAPPLFTLTFCSSKITFSLFYTQTWNRRYFVLSRPDPVSFKIALPFTANLTISPFSSTVKRLWTCHTTWTGR